MYEEQLLYFVSLAIRRLIGKFACKHWKEHWQIEADNRFSLIRYITYLKY